MLPVMYVFCFHWKIEISVESITNFRKPLQMSILWWITASVYFLGKCENLHDGFFLIGFSFSIGMMSISGQWQAVK
jgi:hypothetical protein